MPKLGMSHRPERARPERARAIPGFIEVSWIVERSGATIVGRCLPSGWQSDAGTDLLARARQIQKSWESLLVGGALDSGPLQLLDLDGEPAQLDAVDDDRPGRRGVEAGHAVHEGGLAGAGRAHDGGSLPRSRSTLTPARARTSASPLP